MSRRDDLIRPLSGRIVAIMLTSISSVLGFFLMGESVSADDDVHIAATSSVQHWSFQSIRRPRVPRGIPGVPGHNPIDAFIHRRLAAEHLAPAVEADRATLIRRVHLDLIGLPPSQGKVA